MGRKVWLRYEGYLESDVWKCGESPTGAHHWRQLDQTAKLVRGGYFLCKHCNDVRRFPINFYQYMNDQDRKEVTDDEMDSIPIDIVIASNTNN